jgi:hypothetical protein
MGGELASGWKLEGGKVRIEKHDGSEPRSEFTTECKCAVKTPRQDAGRLWRTVASLAWSVGTLRQAQTHVCADYCDIQVRLPTGSL